MRTEFAPNTISDRTLREYWVADGALDTTRRANLLAKKMLAEHEPQGIPDELNRRIRERFSYIREAEAVRA
jgi:trimethylamine:corrinoid methyltransferase-like protein